MKKIKFFCKKVLTFYFVINIMLVTDEKSVLFKRNVINKMIISN